jgi:membrane-bound ClpP family serine protease
MLLRACAAAWAAILFAAAIEGGAVNAQAPEDQAAAAKAAADVENAKAADEQPADDQPPADEPEKPAADSPAGDAGDGRSIRVRLPLTGDADSRINSTIQRVVDQLSRLPRRNGRRPTLVLELSPQRGNAGFGEGTDFTRALSLANYLMRPEMTAVKTVAYIPRSIKGHGVLIALACDQIVMHPEAEIGEASIDEDSSRAIDPKIVNAYKEIVAAKRTVPQAIALGMVDRRLEVLKVETDQGTEFVLGNELDALKKEHTIISQEIIVPSGSLGSFTGREGHEYGLLLASDADALARGLGLPVAAVKEDQSMLGNRRPVIVRVEGPITRRKVHQLETIIGTELRNRNVNWIGLSIDSAGGNLEDCLRLAETLAALDVKEVQTVAYVPVEAAGGAAIVALACNQLVMQPEAHVGGKGTVELDRQSLDDAHEQIRDSLAKNVAHSWSLIAATIDPDIELFTYQNTKTGDVRYFSDEEAKAQPDAENWQRGARIKPAGETLRLSSNRAQELGVAAHVVDDFDELKQLYGFNGEIRVAEPNWATELIEALSSPALAWLLLVIGFVGVYVELHSPGVGAGGFVAALAFLLFFWSNFLNGTAEWLEVLLFLGGIFFLLLEVLVLPGFGVFGLGGGAMILASLVLATQTFVLPRTESQMVELRHSLTIVAAATLTVVIASIALRRYLPSAPLFRKLLLNPPPEEELADLHYRESLADFSHLVGQQGVATTNLMPAGKADFDGQLVDVIAEGLPIDRGSAIVVVKARGNRVLVRAVEG